jgi:hypothetical protein
MSAIEQILVDYFVACGTVVERQDGEWFIFCGRHGAGISLTSLAIEIARRQAETAQGEQK